MRIVPIFALLAATAFPLELQTEAQAQYKKGTTCAFLYCNLDTSKGPEVKCAIR